MNVEAADRPILDERPIDALLAAYAARTLEAPLQVLVESHLAMKGDNRAYVAGLEAAQGVFLADMEPVPLTGRDRRLVRIFAAREAREIDRRLPEREPVVAADEPALPAALRRYIGCELAQLPWRAVLGGVEQAVIAEGRFGEASFLRCRAGKRFRWHGHTGLEAILVLKGAFSNEQGHYGIGDIAVADESCIHRPEVDQAGEFICFRVAQDPMKVQGPVGRMLEQIFGR